MNGSRHGRDCTWEYRPPWGLGDDQRSGQKIENLGLKLGPNIWLPNWYIKGERFGFGKGKFW